MSCSQDTGAGGPSSSSSAGASPNLPRSVSCSLPFVSRDKLGDMSIISEGANGTVCQARHSDWRTVVAVKCIPMHRSMVESDKSSILKEAEILHKARFNFILPILGMYNEPPSLGFVTEYMANGSLDQLLLQKDVYPDIPWSIRCRILYEIALGVNFLHNMNPPLLHHDLKTSNILMDSEFHVKIADFGLSKWRSLSLSQKTIDAISTGGGTVVYMPPEEYDLSRKTRASVKHDIYSYAIIMWEVFSRKQPFQDAASAMQIMFNVANGARPDISEDSLPPDIPHREMMILLMTSGWSKNPDDRPPFLKCLLDLEPIMLEFDEIDILEAVLQIKKAKAGRNSRPNTLQSDASYYNVRERETPETESNAAPNMLMSHPSHYNIPVGESPETESNAAPNMLMSHPSHYNIPVGESQETVRDTTANMLGSGASHYNIPVRESTDVTRDGPSKEDSNISSLTENLTAKSIGPCVYTPTNPTSPGDNGGSCIFSTSKTEFLLQSIAFQETIHEGAASRWIEEKREKICSQMTEACANQCLDALLANYLLMTEDYELIKTKPTRTSKVRQLIDTCKGEQFARVIVNKLKENRQMGLQPFPDFSQENQSASCHFNSMSTF